MSFSDKVGGEKEAREVLSQQRKIMKAQDETLDSISETMERLKHIGYVVLFFFVDTTGPFFFDATRSSISEFAVVKVIFCLLAICWMLSESLSLSLSLSLC